MESALIIDAFVLVAALEADLGRHRKIGPWRILRPLFAAAAIIPLFLKAVTTTGAGLYLEIALAGAGVALGLAATALMSVYRSPGTGRAVSRSGAGRAVEPGRRRLRRRVGPRHRRPRRLHLRLLSLVRILAGHLAAAARRECRRHHRRPHL